MREPWGLTYPLGQHTRWRRLKESGLLSRTDKNRATYWASVEGTRKRVLHFAADTVLPCTTGTPGTDEVVHENG